MTTRTAAPWSRRSVRPAGWTAHRAVEGGEPALDARAARCRAPGRRRRGRRRATLIAQAGPPWRTRDRITRRGAAVLGPRWPAPRRRRSRPRTRPARQAGRAGRRRPSTGIGRVSASARTAPSRPRSASTGGWMPRTRSRSSASAAPLDSPAPRPAAPRPRPGRASSSSSARPMVMPSATSRACAPSCRSRSMRRSSAAWASTASARVAVSSVDPGASRAAAVGREQPAREPGLTGDQVPRQAVGHDHQQRADRHQQPRQRAGPAGELQHRRAEGGVGGQQRVQQRRGQALHGRQPQPDPSVRLPTPTTNWHSSQARSRQVAGSPSNVRVRASSPRGNGA